MMISSTKTRGVGFQVCLFAKVTFLIQDQDFSFLCPLGKDSENPEHIKPTHLKKTNYL